ncbi:MAG: YdcF family protein [Aquificota bacterium]|nr:YdcF family protein [Aquificota bacterium]
MVLGGGVYNSGELKATSYKRLMAGYRAHLLTGLPLILSGGTATGLVPESEVMKGILEDLGVEESYILTDSRSRDTRKTPSRSSGYARP